MRNVGNKGCAHLLELGDRVAHAVEIMGKLPDFVRAALRDTHIKVPMGKIMRSLGNTTQRFGHTARQEIRNHDTQRQHNRRNNIKNPQRVLNQLHYGICRRRNKNRTDYTLVRITENIFSAGVMLCIIEQAKGADRIEIPVVIKFVKQILRQMRRFISIGQAGFISEIQDQAVGIADDDRFIAVADNCLKPGQKHLHDTRIAVIFNQRRAHIRNFFRIIGKHLPDLFN